DRNPPNAIGVVSVDINGLKNLNIIYGHEYGDYVLKRVGAIMREQLGDVVYRVSGDEFVGLCVNGSRDVFQERIIALRQAFAANRECDVSMGCAWSFGQVDAKAQYQQADENRELEKQSYYLCALNKGQTNVRAEGFTAEVLREVSGGSFIVHYQPQLELKTGKLVGVEALVRKVDDNGCLISPDKFISFYEVSGVISHVDLFVLRKACAAVRHWQEKGLSLNVSVNFSRMTLMLPNIVGTISKICDEAEISPSCITIEVTESVSKIAHEQLKMLIKRLKSVGFSISLDDFGSEYSNLAILSAIKFDEVKFDKTLVSTLEHNRHSRVVMENSINMCRGLDRTRSLAEGIETRGQLDLLLAYQCDYGQGNYFSRPLPLVELDAYIRNLEEGARPL
ncbi:MAG: GGDEF domain-containing phosphodiesterase, partial [Desulfovibrionaceae bacterium]|nr:GGDEF domain-containing phosphodiesterase [Desulfovibrionaceae bacterium]